MSRYNNEYQSLPYKTVQDIAKALGVTRQYAFMYTKKAAKRGEVTIYSISNSCLCLTDSDFNKLLKNYEEKRKNRISKKASSKEVN